MKHILLLTMLLLFAANYSGNAQTNRGTVMMSLHNFSPKAPEEDDILNTPSVVGISFGKYRTGTGKYDGVKYLIVGLCGTVNYFVTDDLSTGLTMNFRSLKVTEIGDDDYEYKTWLFMTGPIIHYFIPIKNHAKVWLSGSGAFGYSQFRYGGGNDPEAPIQLSKYAAGTGVAFFLGEKCSIDMGLEFNLYKVERKNTLDFLEETNTSLTFDIGFSVFLGKRKSSLMD